ncbi:hypothetical protein BAQU_0566 [Bifidobacterium aquikefiri]|uniref:Uncharacterized protein n=1 Tax=Bifidobacterium aquikefiri TaxID=1653207 RepID=A0A261G914_9BIFI|nr:hypothetical protein BAQU_0566 [Bifidobacterium aquikefiri]
MSGWKNSDERWRNWATVNYRLTAQQWDFAAEMFVNLMPSGNIIYDSDGQCAVVCNHQLRTTLELENTGTWL